VSKRFFLQPLQPFHLLGCVLAMLGAALLVSPALANEDFRVNQTTGLEIDSPTTLFNTPRGNASSTASALPKGRGASGSELKPGERKPTEITASKETTFDEKARVAVFTGDVTVIDEQFDLKCEKLTAYLKKAGPESGKGSEKDSGKSSDKTAEKPEAAANKEKKDPDAGGGLERVVAEGNVVITQEKVATNGEVTRYVGKAARAEYNAATGDVTLTGWPQIQQGINNQVATEEGTVMILNRSGRLKTIGPSKTVIKESAEPPKPKGGTAQNSRRSSNFLIP